MQAVLILSPLRGDISPRRFGEKRANTYAGEAPRPDAQVIGALDEDIPETSSPIDESYEVEITNVSEHTSELSIKEQLDKEKEKMIKIKVEPQAVDPDDPTNKPLKVILPGGSKPMDVPHTSSSVTPPSKKAIKGKRTGEESPGKKSKK